MNNFILIADLTVSWPSAETRIYSVWDTDETQSKEQKEQIKWASKISAILGNIQNFAKKVIG
jgi:hypothetical protein